MVKGSVGKRLLVVKIMGFFFLLVEVCTVKVVYIQICQSTAKTMFISRGATFFFISWTALAEMDFV